MRLFIFQQVSNPERGWFEEGGLVGPIMWHTIYAFHPDRAIITKEEWEAMVERAERRCKPEVARARELNDQIMDQLKKEGLRVSDPTFEQRLDGRLQELGAIPAGITKSILEILQEEGFQVVKPQELTYQAPLYDHEARILDRASQLDEEIS